MAHGRAIDGPINEVGGFDPDRRAEVGGAPAAYEATGAAAVAALGTDFHERKLAAPEPRRGVLRRLATAGAGLAAFVAAVPAAAQDANDSPPDPIGEVGPDEVSTAGRDERCNRPRGRGPNCRCERDNQCASAACRGGRCRPADDGARTGEDAPAGAERAGGPSAQSRQRKGPTGPTGPTGPVGVGSGPQGPVGPQGLLGPVGPQGGIGPAGAEGPIGSRGLRGDAGAAGQAGSQGIQGATGPQGPAGPSGSQGAQGPQGVAGSGGSLTVTKVLGTAVDAPAGNSTTVFISADCPSGVAIGGGYTSSGDEVVLVESNRQSETTWALRVRNIRSNPGVSSVTPFVICLG
jgi:hypothetical protein